MNNDLKLKTAFAFALGIDISKITEELEYNSIPEWDSVGHMSLITGIEENFSLSLESDDIINLSSFAKAKEILESKGVVFNDEILL